MNDKKEKEWLIINNKEKKRLREITVTEIGQW